MPKQQLEMPRIFKLGLVEWSNGYVGAVKHNGTQLPLLIPLAASLLSFTALLLLLLLFLLLFIGVDHAPGGSVPDPLLVYWKRLGNWRGRGQIVLLITIGVLLCLFSLRFILSVERTVHSA